MKKIVFCYPSYDKENVGTELLYSPLSLAYIARHTPDYFEKSIVDEYVGEDLQAETVDADIVAFSSLSSGIYRAYELSDILRARGIITVIGGAHATALPREAKEHFDVIITGEGETPWRKFIADYEKGAFDSEYFGKMDVSLDDLGSPDRNIIHKNYDYPSLMTSRGCPFHCSFCYLTVFKYRKYRTIPHETVLEDIESIKDRKVLIITDENFVGYSQEDFDDRKILLQKIIDKKFGLIWGCQASTNIAEDPELMNLMYKAGCRAVFIGFEAADEEALKSVNKTQNFNLDYKGIIAKLHKHKIAVIASTILGMDNQKAGYHKVLIKELKRINADVVRVFYMTAWPGTVLYKQLQKENRVPTNWRTLRKDIPTTKFKHYSHEDIIKARAEILGIFFGKMHLIKLVFVWIFRDPTLLGLFLKIWWRSKSSEKIRNDRAYLTITSKEKDVTQNKPRRKKKLVS